ncbi:MAG: hypothetical protein OXC62_13595 [Aestuariivita sp.]|nr:hypothetical protein [Aestuariivita sp.]
MTLTVFRLSVQVTGRGQKAKQGRRARDAHCGVRWRLLALPVATQSARRVGEDLSCFRSFISKRTPYPQTGQTSWNSSCIPVSPIDNHDAAVEVIELYRRRRQIEEWHRLWKTGCRSNRLHMSPACGKNTRLPFTALTTLGLKPVILFLTAEMAVINDFVTYRNLPQLTNLARPSISSPK